MRLLLDCLSLLTPKDPVMRGAKIPRCVRVDASVYSAGALLGRCHKSKLDDLINNLAAVNLIEVLLAVYPVDFLWLFVALDVLRVYAVAVSALALAWHKWVALCIKRVIPVIVEPVMAYAIFHSFPFPVELIKIRLLSR